MLENIEEYRKQIKQFGYTIELNKDYRKPNSQYEGMGRIIKGKGWTPFDNEEELQHFIEIIQGFR
jgi:hypothetical protein